MSLFNQLSDQWKLILKDSQPLLDEIESKIDISNVTPPFEKIMAAFQTPPENVRVVIFGQDPYPTPGYAVGLSFSVPAGSKKLPPSLRNIFSELHQDCAGVLRTDGDLRDWQGQGVFLLNRVLTTEAGISLAHAGFGWEEFTQAVAQYLGDKGCIGVFWGKKSQSLKRYFKNDRIIESAHPSPLSAYRGFFGSQPFSSINRMLTQQGQEPIRW